MNATEIKKALYKEKPMAKKFIQRENGDLDYCAQLSSGNVYFRIPKHEQYNSDGKLIDEFTQEEIKATLLIRWLQ